MVTDPLMVIFPEKLENDIFCLYFSLTGEYGTAATRLFVHIELAANSGLGFVGVFVLFFPQRQYKQH